MILVVRISESSRMNSSIQVNPQPLNQISLSNGGDKIIPIGFTVQSKGKRKPGPKIEFQ